MSADPEREAEAARVVGAAAELWELLTTLPCVGASNLIQTDTRKRHAAMGDFETGVRDAEAANRRAEATRARTERAARKRAAAARKRRTADNDGADQ